MLKIDGLTVRKRQKEPDPRENKNLQSLVENQEHKLIYSSRKSVLHIPLNIEFILDPQSFLVTFVNK